MNKKISQENFPSKFIDRMQEILPAEELENFLERCTKPLPKTIRCTKDFKIPKGWTLKPVSGISQAFFIDRADKDIPLGKTLEHLHGQFYIAGLSSLLAVEVLNPQPDEKILDMCAAPGSKTTFIADKMEQTGVLIANELSSSRSGKLVSNLDRMGVRNTLLLQFNGKNLTNYFTQEFDRILLDAPCSSEGASRKNANFFTQQWRENHIFQASKLQKELIESSFKMLRVGGEMIYSTCTSAPEENEEVVQFLLDKFPSAKVLPIKLGAEIPHHNGVQSFRGKKFSREITKNVIRLYPHLHNENWDSESFFICKITKNRVLKDIISPIATTKPDLEICHKNAVATILKKWEKQFGVGRENFTEKCFIKRKKGELWLNTPWSGRIASRKIFRRYGFKVCDEYGNLTTDWCQVFGKFATKNILEITEEQDLQKWLDGYDFSWENFPELSKIESEVCLVKYQGFCLGWGKINSKRKILKNKRNRNLIRS